MTVLLAVDGGNSKTDVALLSGDGSILAGSQGIVNQPGFSVTTPRSVFKGFQFPPPKSD